MHPGGRPRLFKTSAELEKAIQSYFAKRRTKVTLTGLALHLGFESRQSFYDYEKEGEFSYAMKKARLKVESFYEENLMSRNATGAIFALKNFGWKDKQEVEHSGEMGITWHEEKTYTK